MTYPNIEAYKIPIHTENPGPPGVKWDEVAEAIGHDRMDEFGEFFGCQTMSENGMYPWDVEPVLERMLTGRITGTQLFWD